MIGDINFLFIGGKTMIRDIEVIMEKEDYDIEDLMNDLDNANLNLIWAHDPELEENGMIVYRGFLDEQKFNRLMTFVSASPLGNGYEVLEWKDGDSKKLW